MQYRNLKTIEKVGNDVYILCKHFYNRRGWNLFVVKEGLYTFDSPYLDRHVADGSCDGEIKLEFVESFKTKKKVIEFLDKKQLDHAMSKETIDGQFESGLLTQEEHVKKMLLSKAWSSHQTTGDENETIKRNT